LNIPERISRPSCEMLYATNTSPHEQEIFIYEYPLPWVLSPIKTTECCSLVEHSSSTFAILTVETSLWTYAFAYSLLFRGICPVIDDPRRTLLHCNEAGFCSYLVVHIENLLCPLQLFYCHFRHIYWLSLILAEANRTVVSSLRISVCKCTVVSWLFFYAKLIIYFIGISNDIVLNDWIKANNELEQMCKETVIAYHKLRSLEWHWELKETTNTLDRVVVSAEIQAWHLLNISQNR
jgi:hypothetical protein